MLYNVIRTNFNEILCHESLGVFFAMIIKYKSWMCYRNFSFCLDLLTYFFLYVRYDGIVDGTIV